MDTQITVTVKFIIPHSEIAEIDEKQLKDWLLFQVGQRTDMESGGQFGYYELANFNPVVKELWKNAKKLI